MLRFLLVFSLFALVAGCSSGTPTPPVSNTSCGSASECQAPASSCMVATCIERTCGTAPAAARAVCSERDGGFCNGEGACVSCIDGSDCPSNRCNQGDCLPVLCGNGALDEGEECDGTLPTGKRCDELTGADGKRFTGGTLTCATTCEWSVAGCTRTVPSGWICAAANYAAGDGCHCGCGVHDPDCANQAASACEHSEVCPEGVDPADPTRCLGDCGNLLVDAGELCDRTNLNGKSCLSEGFTSGVLACASNCKAFDTKGCHTCGDGTLSPGEECDGTMLSGKSCTDLTNGSGEHFSGGVLACNTACKFNVSACYRATCQSPEECPLPETTCLTRTCAAGICGTAPAPARSACSEGGGTLCDGNGACVACLGDTDCGGEVCKHGLCMAASCGNGLKDTGESCDGAALGAESCQTKGFQKGTLACAADCKGYNLQGCETCGDAKITGTEGCDGHQVPESVTCRDFDWNGIPFTGGSLHCSECRVITAMCTRELPNGWGCSGEWYGTKDGCDCGCGVPDPDCDNDTLAACHRSPCSEGMTGVDPANTTRCLGCGNGQIEFGEECDGSALGGMACTDLSDEWTGRYIEGTLQCTASCTVDTTDCRTWRSNVEPTPAEWTCNDDEYWSRYCYCGCGTVSPACGDGAIEQCQVNSCGSGFAVDPTSTTRCIPAPPRPASWTCEEYRYGNRYCDCGCGAPDPDCNGRGIEACDNADVYDYSLFCPYGQRLDPADPWKCIPVDLPAGWNCDTELYSQFRGCVCGCGTPHPYCDTAGIESCEWDLCTRQGKRADPADPTKCKDAMPSGWTCDPIKYGDKVCDCGCGIPDVDCQGGATCALNNCDGALDPVDSTKCLRCGNGWVESWETCDGALHDRESCQDQYDSSGHRYIGGTLTCSATCTLDISGCIALQVPRAWTCNPRDYSDDWWCNCGCGIQDPDCDANDLASCDYFQCAVDPTDPTRCIEVPAGWTCEAYLYGGNSCDCGCGIADPACGGPESSHCTGARCPAGTYIDPFDNAQCLPIVAGWTCDAGDYWNGFCDCGCGVQDPDCIGLGLAQCSNHCTRCDEHGCTEAKVDPTDLTKCITIPDTWACAPYSYADGLCHCACGAKDFDCNSTTSPGECKQDNCGSDIVDPLDTTKCKPMPPLPSWWICAEYEWTNQICDCGCGIQDFACGSTTDRVECGSSNWFRCGDFQILDPLDTTRCITPPSPPAGWLCSSTLYGNKNCECGCGVTDIDCLSGQLSECRASQCVSRLGPGHALDPEDATACIELPAPQGWTCAANLYADDICYCGCGVRDMDCPTFQGKNTCNMDGCPPGSMFDPASPFSCITDPSPEAWTCLGQFFGTGLCDCGCGAKDPDCASTTSRVECGLTREPTIGHCDRNKVLDPLDTTRCIDPPAPPTGWLCDSSRYGDRSCDCGCGAEDIDCLTNQLSECRSHNCVRNLGPGHATDPESPGLCIDAPVPQGWTCAENLYADSICTCGCGVMDIDCSIDAAYTACGETHGCAPGSIIDPGSLARCIPDPTPAEWTCPPQVYGDGECDCGCNAPDPDCADGVRPICVATDAGMDGGSGGGTDGGVDGGLDGGVDGGTDGGTPPCWPPHLPGRCSQIWCVPYVDPADLSRCLSH